MLHKFENMERCAPWKKIYIYSATLNQGRVLKTNSKLKNNSKFVFQ